ncbi:MAG: hypothetical protein IPQ07_13795 [Myxococcales bacterium]|nr:hypothetical protein [Myxococcales bacterium]
MKVLIGILPLVTGCVFDDDERVAPIGEFRPVTTIAGDATITFEHGGSNLDSPDCLLLEDSATATLAGLPFELVVRGGYIGGGECEFPQMKLLDLPELPDATLELRDSHTSIDCPLGDTLTPFAIDPVPAGPWRFAPGQTVTVNVAQPADTTDLRAALVSADRSRVALMITHVGSEISFRLPAAPSGAFELEINALHTITGTQDFNNRCGGLLFTSHHAHRPITIAP